MKHIEFDLQSHDGLRLYVQGWAPEERVRGVVFLVHGLGEHSGRYAHLGTRFSQQGYAVLALDLRGHGKSEGLRGHVPDYGTVYDDLSLWIKSGRQRYPDVPQFLYGHSLGGNIILAYVMEHKPTFTGVIATGPALRLPFQPPPIKVLLGRLMNRIWPSFVQPSGLDTQALSRDSDIVQKYIADPLVHDRISARLFTEFFETGLQLLERAAEFPLPLLLMHGSEDRLTDPDASREFAHKMGDHCTLKIWEGFYHEIHNEPEKDLVFTFTLKWMDEMRSKE